MQKTRSGLKATIAYMMFLVGLLVFSCAQAASTGITVHINETAGGGAIPNVKVTIINFGTGKSDERTTNSSGNAEFSPLDQGVYFVSIVKSDGTTIYYPNAKSMDSADRITVLAGKSVPISLNYYASLPEITVWPSSGNAETNIGNPASISINVANGSRSLADLQSFSMKFDDLDVTEYVVGLPPRNFVGSGNTLILNLPHIELPAGKHTLSIKLGNKGLTPVTVSRVFNIQNSMGLERGIHTPPVEDWVAPFNDWQVEFERINKITGRNHTLIGYFTSWADTSGAYTDFNSFLNDQIAAVGAVPVITWEPWKNGGGASQPSYSNSSISSGGHDDFIRKFAKAAKAYGKPLILRLMHEFNGVYYPWAGPNNENDPSLFKQAFRHVVDIFREEGANNAEFMWSPNYQADARVTGASRDIYAFYPGNDVVDWIGVSGYNWGTDIRMQAEGWLTFDQIFDSTQFGNFLSTMELRYPNKKVIIAEVGTNAGDATHSKEQWIADAMSSIKRHKNVGGYVWFNNTAVHDAAHMEADFRIISAPGASTEMGKSSVSSSITDAYSGAIH